MGRIKDKLELFQSFVYDSYIQEEFEILNTLGLVIIKPAWLVRSIFVWFTCPLLMPEFLIKQTKVYQNLKGSFDDLFKMMEQQLNVSRSQQSINKQNNKITQNNFINRRFGKGGNFLFNTFGPKNKKN